ncbi:RDD family protein [Streptomyces sp. NBC_01262]|uniref:RDD family protein n=1 Tax=Streptomyces sp. NBC_01262 TaxID=2903803 RepID=UPI002E309C53|nr:RDD family protein [Streptomyces sp. NBC_01262]
MAPEPPGWHGPAAWNASGRSVGRLRDGPRCRGYWGRQPGVRAGPHGRRIAARCVDVLIAAVFSFVAVGLIGASADTTGLLVLALVAWPATAVFYFTASVHWWGTTAGKRLFGLRVVRLWSDGTLPPSWKDAFIREFDRAAFLSIPVLNLLVGAILLVQMARDRGSYHQSKFDRAARTVVVRWLAVVGAGI